MANQIELSKSYLHEIIRLFNYSFSALHVKSSPANTEAIAIKIHNVMEARWRKYHTVEHIFSVCDTRSPHQILAGIFHDLVYLQLDRRIHPQILPYLADFDLPEDKSYTIEVKNSDDPQEDFDPLDIVNRIFGFQNGQKLNPSTGANEYLSAIVAIRLLSNTLNISRAALIRIVACIEATIPFRRPKESEESVPLQLFQRIKRLNNQFHYGMAEQEVHAVIKDAVELANRDVISFSHENFSSFISNTWKLILEGNPVFKNPMFTIIQYRTALSKIEKFYADLDHSVAPSVIYRTYDHPTFDSQAIQSLAARAKSNLKLGREYFQASLIAAGFVEAIAKLTGGDAPMVLFMGQMSNKFVNQFIIAEDFLNLSLPALASAQANPKVVSALDSMLYDALTLGHPKKISMASYIYKRIEREERMSLYNKATELFDGELDPLAYINLIKLDLRDSLINALAQIATTRSSEILDIKKSLNILARSAA